jgi:hypothetical protein
VVRKTRSNGSATLPAPPASPAPKRARPNARILNDQTKVSEDQCPTYSRQPKLSRLPVPQTSNRRIISSTEMHTYPTSEDTCEEVEVVDENRDEEIADFALEFLSDC